MQPKYTYDIEQGSDDWFNLRLGKFTASRAKDLMAKTKTGVAASRGNIIARLACERLTNARDEGGFKSYAMQRGNDMEQEALDAYSFAQRVAVQPVSFVEHGSMPYVSCSPDGLIGEDGGVEIKCPDARAKHFNYLKNGSHAIEYKWQLQQTLFVTGRKWWDIVSYDPNYPEGLQLAIKRVFPIPEMQEEYKTEVIKGEMEVVAMIAEMERLKQAA